MRPYKALLFDLCDTLMPFRNDRLPLVEIRGRQVRTTSPLLYESFSGFSAIPYEEFHDHFVETTEAIWRLREESEKEISSATRFERFLEKLGVPRGADWERLHRRFLETHLGQIALCLDCAPEHRRLLNQLKRRYRLGLVSNFDDTDTVYRVLAREGVDHLFEAILISSEIGIRKPHADIFLAACEKIGISPSDALFVGDSFENDVVGAKQLGMDAAWINRTGLPPPIARYTPDYSLTELADLSKII
ncbi:MAG: HAD family hydrolase [Nitrospirae bacterium]|nr:HAD family hydrolase [Candidatus Manganitrophaceae bacterium]